MAEPDLRADAQELFRVGGGHRAGPQAQSSRGPPQQRGVTGGVGRRQQHQLPGRTGQDPDPAQIGLLKLTLELAGPARLAGADEAARQLRFGHFPGQFQQPQGVSPGLGDNSGANLLIQVTGDSGRQQRPRVLAGEPLDGHGRQAGEHVLVGGLPDREQQANRFRQQPPSDKSQQLGGGLIQPLGVIDQADQGPGDGIGRQQAQHGQADEEPIGRGLRRQSERHLQRMLLRDRQVGQAAQHRLAELVQRRERQLHLRFHAFDLRHPAASGLAGAVAQQRGLADPGLAPDDEHRAPAAADTVQQPVESLALAGTSPEGRQP
jgi:hypothetical protein